VAGTISSDGGDGINCCGANNSTGGGAGGTVYITTNTLAGAGSITAKGGAAANSGGNDGGGGSGGRVAIYYDSKTYTGSYDAYGDYGDEYGGAGTLYVKDNAVSGGDFTVDNNGNAGTSTPLFTADQTSATVYSFTVSGSGILNIDSPGVCGPIALTILNTVDVSGGTVNNTLTDASGVSCVDRSHVYTELNIPAGLYLNDRHKTHH